MRVSAFLAISLRTMAGTGGQRAPVIAGIVKVGCRAGAGCRAIRDDVQAIAIMFPRLPHGVPRSVDDTSGVWSLGFTS